MRSLTLLAAPLAALALAGCGSGADDSEGAAKSNQVLEGTISDDMINTDEAIDDVPVQSGADVSAPVASGDASPAKTDAADTAKVEASGESK